MKAAQLSTILILSLMFLGVVPFALPVYGAEAGAKPETANAKQKAVSELIAAAIKTSQLIQDPRERAGAHTKIAEAQAKTGDIAGARASLDRAVAARISNDYFKVFLAKAQAIAGDVAGAKATAAEISNDSPKSAAYEEIAKAQAMAGDVAGAKATAAEISDNKYKYRKEAAYEGIAEAQAKAGDIAGAKATAAEFGTSDMSAYSAIAKTQAEAGDVVGAKATAAEISSKIYKTQAYMNIAKAQAMAGDVAGARATAAEVRATATGNCDESFEASAYSAIAKAQAMAGDVAGAKETAAKISYKSTKAVAYGGIAGTQAKAGDIAGARDSLDKAKAAAAKISDESSKESAYGAIAEAQAKAGDVAGAKATATAAEISSKISKAHAYKEIAIAQAKSGDVAGAIKFVANAAEKQSQQCEWLAAAAEELCSSQSPPKITGKKSAEAESALIPPQHAQTLDASTTSSPQAKADTAREAFERGKDSEYLDQLLRDPTYGNVNRAIANKIGDQMTKAKLGIELGTMNNLAKKTTMTADDVLTLFEQGLRKSKELLPDLNERSAACLTLDTLRSTIAWRAGYEESLKKGQ